MRLCIFLLVVALVLWWSGLLIGANQDDATLPDPDEAPDFLEHLQSLMPEPPPLVKADLMPVSCLDYPYLRPSTSGACTVVVRTGEDTRATTLELVDGTAKVTFKDNRRPDKSASSDLPAEVDDEETDRLDLQVSEDGGEISVRCRGGKTCVVRLIAKQ